MTVEIHNNKDFSNSYIYKRKGKNIFLKKITILGSFIFIMQILSIHFTYYNENTYAFSLPEFKENTIILDEEGFVLKKSIQTEKRKKDKQKEIIFHKVEAGETLSKIASDYDIKLETILSANPTINPWKAIKVGTELSILPIDGISIKIEKDTEIETIAKKYKIEKSSILIQNQLGTGTLIISKGTQLILPGAKTIKKVVVQKYSNKAPAKGSDYSYTGPISSHLIMPAGGTITQYYHRGHYAIDIAHRGKGPIFAAADGVIIEAKPYGWNGGYGQMILIDHGKGMTTRYAHNEKIYVQAGQQVKQGETIAWMGRTGRVRGVTGIHLHFEVIINGTKRNPLAYIK